MAVSKTLTANGSKGHHRFTLYVNESSTSGNNSYLDYSLVISPIQSGWDWNASGVNYSITIGSNTFTGPIYSYNGSSTSTIKSGSNLEIAHNSDGTKTINIAFSITDTTGYNFTPGNASASDTMTLTVLHKAPLIGTAQVSELNTVVSNLNVPATTVVRYLSKKRFTLNATPYDSTTLTYRIRGFAYDSGIQSSNTIDVDFRTDGEEITFKNNTVQITQYAYDSLGASSSDDIKVLINNTPSVLNIIDYAKPILEKTNTTIKRKSGNGTNLTDNKANINLVGTIYKVNNAIGNNNAIRTIGYKVWEKGTSEPANYTSFSTTPTPSSSGAVTITNYEISNIDFTKAYNYKIILEDIYSNGTTYYSDIAEGTIPLGQPTWSEYKDRVDFLALTREQKQIYANEYSSNEIAIGIFTSGETIYRKYLGSIGQITGTTSKSFDISNISIDKIIKIDGMINYDTNYVGPLSRTVYYYNESNGYITIYNANNLSIDDGFVYIEYTKQ